MASQFKFGSALAACALFLVSASAFAQTPSFNFNTVPGSIVDNIPIDSGPNAVTVGLTGSSGVSATFTDPNSSGNFYFSADTAPFVPALGSIVLTETGSTGDTLDVSFSQAINAIQFGFSLTSFATGGSLNVALYNGATLLNTISDATTLAYPGTNQFSVGNFAYGGAAITNLVITGTGPIILGTPVPEPTTWALMGLGLLAVAGVASRRSSAAV